MKRSIGYPMEKMMLNDQAHWMSNEKGDVDGLFGRMAREKEMD